MIILHSLLILEKGVFDEAQHRMIVLQLGELRLKSEQNQIRQNQSEELDFEQLKLKAYDRYSLKMDNLQIMAARPGDKWRESLETGACLL